MLVSIRVNHGADSALLLKFSSHSFVERFQIPLREYFDLGWGSKLILFDGGRERKRDRVCCFSLPFSFNCESLFRERKLAKLDDTQENRTKRGPKLRLDNRMSLNNRFNRFNTRASLDFISCSSHFENIFEKRISNFRNVMIIRK